jgi:hypothetical protein
MTYVAELEQELAAVGIAGRLRRRILAEVADHLSSDETAVERFGPARRLANLFAAELGARCSRRSTLAAFAALAVGGVIFAVSFVGQSRIGRSPGEPLLAAIATLLIVIAPQVAFVSGSLGLLRVVRRRGEGVLPEAERSVVDRRTATALTAGLVTMGALLVLALENRGQLAAWWVDFTLVASSAAIVLLLVAAVPLVQARRLRPVVSGPAGDVFDDVGFEQYRSRPWSFALRVALLVGLAVWIAGIATADPFDGLLRGVVEALACLAGFGLLGRYLGLRETA